MFPNAQVVNSLKVKDEHPLTKEEEIQTPTFSEKFATIKDILNNLTSSMVKMETALETQAKERKEESERYGRELKESTNELNTLKNSLDELKTIVFEPESFNKFTSMSASLSSTSSSNGINFIPSSIKEDVMNHKCSCSSSTLTVMPKCNPKFRYDGNPRTYHDFIQRHETIVNSGNFKDWQKLDILLDSCKGEALDLISRCCYMSTAKGYEAALDILSRLSGSKVSRQVSLYVELAEMAQVDVNNIKTLTDLRNLTNHAFTMHKHFQDPPLDSLQRFKNLVIDKKLDEKLKEDWIKYNKNYQNDDKLHFERLVDFLFIAVEKIRKEHNTP